MTTQKAPMSIEDAIRRSAEPVGGLLAAAVGIGVGEGVVSAAANPNKPDMLRLDHAILLDRLCKLESGRTPIFDHFRASLREVDGPPVSHHEHLAAFVREAGDVTSTMVAALEDNKMDAAERQAVLGELADLRGVIARMIRDLKSESNAHD